MERSLSLYTFWEGQKPPTYLQLCMDTWYENINDLNVEVINYENLELYVGPYVDIRKLKAFSLAMQSDVISSIVLATRGGTFIDIDTIMLPHVDIEFLRARNQRLNVFGMPKSGAFHVAVMSTTAGNPAVIRWMNEACKRVDLSPQEYRWNYLAGDILEKMTVDTKYAEYFNIIDRRSSGNILEAVWNQKYVDFYFSKPHSDVLTTLREKSPCGILSLHNSWTPSEYSSIDDRETILNCDNTLSQILKLSLGC